MDVASFIASLDHPPASHVVFGALGGLLYIARQWVKNYHVRPRELLVRPLFGGVAAMVLTVWLGLPNHMTSLFVGYFGVDFWDALAARFEPAAMLGKHAPPPPRPPPL